MKDRVALPEQVLTLTYLPLERASEEKEIVNNDSVCWATFTTKC